VLEISEGLEHLIRDISVQDQKVIFFNITKSRNMSAVYTVSGKKVRLYFCL